MTSSFVARVEVLQQSEIIFSLSDFRFLFPLQLLFFLLCPFGCFLICKFTPASVRTNNYCFYVLQKTILVLLLNRGLAM